MILKLRYNIIVIAVLMLLSLAAGAALAADKKPLSKEIQYDKDGFRIIMIAPEPIYYFEEGEKVSVNALYTPYPRYSLIRIGKNATVRFLTDLGNEEHWFVLDEGAKLILNSVREPLKEGVYPRGFSNGKLSLSMVLLKKNASFHIYRSEIDALRIRSQQGGKVVVSGCTGALDISGEGYKEIIINDFVGDIYLYGMPERLGKKLLKISGEGTMIGEQPFLRYKESKAAYEAELAEMLDTLEKYREYTNFDRMYDDIKNNR